MSRPARPLAVLESSIDAKALTIRGENPADLEALVSEYQARFQPVTPQERFFVDILIHDDWQLRRYSKVNTQLIDIKNASEPDQHDRALTGVRKRIEALHRSYRRALRELKRSQAERQREPVDEGIPLAELEPASKLIQ